MIRHLAGTVLLTTALTAASITGGAAQSAPKPVADAVNEQIAIPDGARLPPVGEAAPVKTAEAAVPVFETFDVPLPPRRQVRVVQKPQAKPRKVVVAAAPAPTPVPVQVASVASMPQVAMVKPVPRVWITVGSGF